MCNLCRAFDANCRLVSFVLNVDHQRGEAIWWTLCVMSSCLALVTTKTTCRVDVSLLLCRTVLKAGTLFCFRSLTNLEIHMVICHSLSQTRSLARLIGQFRLSRMRATSGQGERGKGEWRASIVRTYESLIAYVTRVRRRYLVI